MKQSNSLSYRQLCSFFIPLGISASLTSVTHVIINGTLSRGDQAAFIIACYAVAMSLFGMIEGPMIIFRQTTSTLVQNQRAFKLLRSFFLYILLIVISISVVIAFTPLGTWLFTNVFNANEDMVDTISITYKVISIVIVFSGLRALYQGLIIKQLATNWLTIGVVARLVATFIASFLFVFLDYITSVTGALIFLIGVFIECVVSMYKGKQLLKHDIEEDNQYRLLKADISGFYFPLVVYYFLQSILTPSIYVLLAKSNNIEISIASFSMAFSITNMILGFFMYTHQLVLQFYKKGKIQIVIRFLVVISMIPALLLSIVCYTPLGNLFMQNVMGADNELAIATISVLKFFVIKALIFPWVDFLNGFLMLKRKTNKMLFAQIGNLIVVIIVLFISVHIWPHLNGVNGSIAASIGEVTGFIIVSYIIYKSSEHYQKAKLNREKFLHNR